MILNLLSKSYLLFFSHYRMTKPVVNYHSLLESLQTFEKDNQLQKEPVKMMGGSSSGRRPFKKEKNKNKKKVQRAGTPKSSQNKKSNVDKSQTEYFFCKKLGH